MQAELYWINAAPHGRLAIMPRPRAGDWLIDELKSMQSSGVDVVVSLLADDEVADLGLQNESTLCHDVGLTFISHPIADRDVPSSAKDFLAFVNRLDGYLHENRGIAIHCRMGIGRSALVAACLLVKSGTSARQAFECISQERGFNVPDTSDQMEWVEAVSDRLRGGEAAT